jgi:hypothetical protein
VESVFKETVPWLTPQRAEEVAEALEGEPTAEEAEAFRQDAFARDNEPKFGAHSEPEPDDNAPEPDGFESDIPPISPSPETPKRYVVDLGAFEDPAEEEVDALGAPAGEPVFAGAAEKGGIMGAVRAAFVRSRPQHDHEYVEAPGGIGIVRQICTECGHISIGTSD